MIGQDAARSEAGQEKLSLKWGLTTSQIKWIALFSMTLDHLAAFGFEIPVFGRYYNHLRLLGRIAAPLFLFALVQGLWHTRSKSKFMLRLYLAGMGTGLFVAATNLLFGNLVGLITPGNIIFTFFYVALYVWAIERLISSVKEKNLCAVWMPALCCVLPFFAQPLRLALLALTPVESSMAIRFLIHNLIDSFLPTFYSVDYGWGMILLGVLLYFARRKWRQCAVFGGFCLVCIAGAVASRFTYLLYDLTSFTVTFFDPSQCWMVLALPFMMLYNGQRGNGPKWFFYCYYPLHRYLISIAAAIVQAFI